LERHSGIPECMTCYGSKLLLSLGFQSQFLQRKSCMLFCPRCGTLLLVENSVPVRFYCRTCSYIHTVTEKMRSKQVGQKKKHSTIETRSDDKQKDSSMVCPKCSNVGIFFDTAQARSADEGSTYYYECRECGYKWSHNA